jgi:hypothetical protein
MMPSRSDAARLDSARDRSPPDLAEIAQRVARLHPNWQQPERFFELRSDIVHDLRRLARSGLPEVPGHPAGPSQKERRLTVLARSLAGEVERLRRLLAEATRPQLRRRRQTPDGRQMTLPI